MKAEATTKGTCKIVLMYKQTQMKDGSSSDTQASSVASDNAFYAVTSTTY